MSEEEEKTKSVEPFIRANPYTGEWEVVERIDVGLEKLLKEIQMYEKKYSESIEDAKAMEILMNTPVLFGLKQQGHIPTIERMLKDGATWKEIGKEIGWDPKTAKEHWGWHTEGKSEK